ncbi:MAG: hypothetical protein ACHQ50_12515 [Fimbriimonadales bacterium]
MIGAALLLVLAQSEKPTLSEILPAGMANIHYRLVSPLPNLPRPVFPASILKPGAHYFAAVAPDGRTFGLGAVVGTSVYFDVNRDGIFTGPGEIKKLDIRAADWEKGRTGEATFRGFAAEVESESVQLTWHKNDPVPMLSFSAKVGGTDRASRYILCKPASDPAQAPVFDLGYNWSFAPDYINLSIDLAGSLYSPGAKTAVHMEIGTAGLGRNSFLGRIYSDIPPGAYVQAAYNFRDAGTGKLLTYIDALTGRC